MKFQPGQIVATPGALNALEEAGQSPASFLLRHLVGCFHNDPTQPKPEYYSPNEYYLEREFSGELLCIFQDIKNAMMTGNHDNSDAMTDYFDVGWYIDIKIGQFERPFVVNHRVLAGPELTYDQLKARIAVLEAKNATKILQAEGV